MTENTDNVAVTQGFAAHARACLDRCLLHPVACAVEDDLRLQALEEDVKPNPSNGTPTLDTRTVQAVLRLPTLHVAGAVDVRAWVAERVYDVCLRGVVNAPQDAQMYSTMRALAIVFYGLQLPVLCPAPDGMSGRCLEWFQYMESLAILAMDA